MHGDFSRGHRPDRKRGRAYRRVLLQQGRPLLDSDFNALSDANEHLLRELARDMGLGNGSPDGGFLVTTGPLLARFETLEQVTAVGTGFEARLDLRHRYEERLPSLYLDARRGAGHVTLRLRHRLSSSEFPRIRIWARLPGALRVGIGTGAEQPFPGDLASERFRAYELQVPAGVPDFDAITLRFDAASPDNEAWIGLVEGLPADAKIRPFWVSRGRYRVDGLAVELREDAPYPEVSFPKAKGFNLESPTTGAYVAYLEAWERHITHVEDPQLTEPALGGTVDTCTRVEAVGQVKLAKLHASVSGLVAPEPFRAAFARPTEPSRGLRIDLRPLSVDPGSPGSPLSSGYTGAENRLYRFEIHKGGAIGTATLKWSRNNGASLFPVLRVMDGNKTLALAPSVDVRNGDVIEVLTETVELGDESDGQVYRDTAVRFEPPRRKAGELYFVREKGVTGTERLIELRDPSTRLSVALDDKLAGKPGMKIRRWDGFSKTEGTTGSLPVRIDDGLSVHLTGGPFREGDYWQYEARQGQEGMLTPFLPPLNGGERLFVPLALMWLEKDKSARIDVRLEPDPSSARKLRAADVLYDGLSVPTAASTVQEALDELFARQEGDRCQVRLSPGLHGADDGERLAQLIRDKLPDGGVVCLSEGVFRLKSRVEILGKHVELRGHPGAFLVSEVPDASALQVGLDGRLTLSGLTLVAGVDAKVGRRELVSFTADCAGLSARDCMFFHLREDAAGIAFHSEPPLLPSKEPADARGWSVPLVSGAPELRLEGCTLVAGWGISVGNLEGLSLHGTTVLCVKGGIVAKDLGELELHEASFNTGLDAATLRSWAPLSLEQLAAAVATWRAANPVTTGLANSTAVHAARVGSGSVRESTFAADMGLWLGAGANLRLEHNHYFAGDTAVRVDHATDTVLVSEQVAAGNLGVHVPAVALGLSLSDCHVQAPRAVVLGGAYVEAQPLAGVLLQELRLGSNQLLGERVGLQLGPWDVASLAFLGMTARNLDVRENTLRVTTAAGRALSGVLPAQGGVPFVLRLAHNQLEAIQGAVWLKGSGIEVTHNRLGAQGQDTLSETPPEGVLTLAESGSSLIEGNAVHLVKAGAGLCVKGCQDVRVWRNVVRGPESGRPLWVLDSQRVEVGENELETGGCLVTGVQTLTVRGNRLAGLLSIQGSSNGVISQNRLSRATGAALAIDKVRERWQLHENLAAGGIRLLPEVKGVTPPAIEEELAFHAQVQGNWASELQVGYLHPDDGDVLSVRDLPIAKPHPGSEVQVVANRAESRLVVNHYSRFLVTNNAIRELVCGVNALDRIEALNLSRPQGSTGGPGPGGGTDPGGGSSLGQGVGRVLTQLQSGQLLITGGMDASGTSLARAHVYDPVAENWRAVDDMLSPRAHHIATVLSSGVVLVAGGVDGTRMLATSESFDPGTGLWSSIPSGTMAVARQRATVTELASGQVLVVGGMNGTRALASAELYDPRTKTWTLLPGAMTTPRCFHTATRLPSGQVLVTGGLNADGVAIRTAELYDPVTQEWVLVAPMGTPRARATATLMDSGHVLVAGGWDGQRPVSSVERYEPTSKSWSSMKAMAHARQDFTATRLSFGRVLVLGGRGGSGQPMASSEVYDPRIGSWSPGASLGTPRYGHSATPLKVGVVLVVGGMGANASLSSTELYESRERTWAPVSAMKWARSGHAALMLEDRSGFDHSDMLVVGGEGEAAKEVELYDPSDRQWRSIESPSIRWGCTVTLLNRLKPTDPRLVLIFSLSSIVLFDITKVTGSANSSPFVGGLGSGFGRHGHTATLLRDGSVLIVGGSESGGAAPAEILSSTTVLKYSSSASWSTGGRMAQARIHHTATLLRSGNVLVVGGSDGATALPTAEIYDPTLKRWSPARRMTVPRAFHTALLIEQGPLEGKVLVVGGQDSSGVSEASAELYDPARDEWTLLGRMAFARERHTLLRLGSGEVLVGGGGMGHQRALDSVERYDPITDSWSLLPPMQVARFGHAVVERPSGELLVMGGTNDQGSHALVEVYEPRPRRWVFVPRPQDKTFDEWHAVALLQSGGALVSGGAPRENGQTFVHPKRDAMWLNSELGVLESLPPMNDGRAEHTLTTLQSGHILAVGGWDELDTRFSNKRPKSWAELFEPLVGRWSRTEPMTGVRFAHTATLLPSGKVLVVGGMGAKQLTNHIPSFQNVSLKDAELYDPDSRSWSPAGQMEDLRAHHTATLLGPGPLEGKVLVTGGQSKPETGRAGTPLATVELYHPDTGLWEKKKSMPVPLEKHTATLLLDGRVLVVGGKTSFLYQPASGSEGTWSTTGSLSHSRSEHMALRLPDGRVLVAGGGSTALEVYDPGKGTWSILEVEGALPSIPRTATLLPSGEVFVTGSQWDASRGLYADAYAALARRALGGWRSGESLPTRHDRHVAAVLQDGQLLVVGNTTAQLHDPATGRWMDAASPGSTQPCDSATVLQDGRVLVVKRGATELYVPTGTWQTAGLARPMVNNLREGHTATLLPKGHVLVAGGGLNPNTVELYDPQQDTWTPLSPMKKARSNHRAVLLPHAGAEGKVLVVGGMSGSTYLGAEVYDIKANTWMELAAIPVGHLLSVTLLPTGLVLVVGHNDTQSVCGLYDPVTELWRDTRFKPLHTYQDHGATLLPSGRVLLTGGRLNTGQAELFDPTSEAWLPAGALAVPRFAHSALLLPSTGRVLVVGGLVRGPNGATNPATPTAQVELYDELGTRDSWRSGAALPG